VKEDNKLKVIIYTESKLKKQINSQVMKDIIELTKCKLITSKIEKCKTKIALSKLLKK